MSILKKIIEKTEKIPLEIAFLLYEALIICRIFMEMNGPPSIAVTISQLFWFNAVLIIFFISAKYLLKIDQKRLSILALGGFLTFIPIFYSLLLKHDWKLNFIQPVSVGQVCKDIFTLLAFHSYNWPMFPELVLLLLSFFFLGLIFSGDSLKALLVSFFTTYLSFFIMGFSWIAVNQNHPTLFLLSSDFLDMKFYALEHISIFTLFSAIAFYSELVDFIRQKLKTFEIVLLFILTFFLDFILLFLKARRLPLDAAILFLPSLAIVSFCLILYKKAWRTSFLPGWISLAVLTILLV